MCYKIVFCFLLVTRVCAQNGTRIVITSDFGKNETKYINSSVIYIFQYNKNNENLPVAIEISSEKAESEYPLFVIAVQEEIIESWQLPYVVHKSSTVRKYHTLERILCPSILVNISDSVTRQHIGKLNTAITVKTFSPTNFTFTLIVKQHTNFSMQNGVTNNISTTLTKPLYYYYSFKENNSTESVLVTATSRNNTCMIMSIQNSTCPVFDTESDVKYESTWQTMTLQGSTVVENSRYPNGFFIVLVVTQHNSVCETEPEKEINTNDTKIVALKVSSVLSRKDHKTIATITITIFTAIFLILATFGIIYVVIMHKRELNNKHPLINSDSEDNQEDNTNEEIIPRNKKSTVYMWQVMIVALFYTTPVVQLVFTYQNILLETGNEDLCYYNYLCMYPYISILDFNHVLSNIGYIFFGVLFLLIVLAKDFLNRKNQSDARVLQKPYGIYYALAIALIMEGILSGCYHICPKASNFQFDTSFMYVIAVLIIINIYQNRHSRVDKRGYAVFLILAVASTLSAIAVHLENSIYFWVMFSAIQIVIYGLLTWYLDGLLFRKLCNRQEMESFEKCRCTLWILGNLLNLALVIFGLSLYTSIGFAIYLLLVLIIHGLFYAFAYICLKKQKKENVSIVTWIFIVLSSITWAVALFFFVNKVTSWESLPAESRLLNRKCVLVKYYDNHDIWHFLSSVALFFTFIVLLTLDEGIANTPLSDVSLFHH